MTPVLRGPRVWSVRWTGVERKRSDITHPPFVACVCARAWWRREGVCVDVGVEWVGCERMVE